MLMKFARYGFLLACCCILNNSLAMAKVSLHLSENEADVYLAKYVDCIVEHKTTRTVAAKFLKQVINSKPYFALAAEAAPSSCMSVDKTGSELYMMVPTNIFRDALYPAFYRFQFRNMPVQTSIKDLAPLSLSSEFDGPLTALPATYRPQRALGDCISRSSPLAAHLLLTSLPWSPQDAAAIDQLKPAIASCLVQGKTISLTRSALRAYIGEAMFKLVSASPKT